MYTYELLGVGVRPRCLSKPRLVIFHRLRGTDGQSREAFRQQRRQVPDAAELPSTPFAVEPVDHLAADIGVPVEHDPGKRLSVIAVFGAGGFHRKRHNGLLFAALRLLRSLLDLLQNLSQRTIPPGDTKLKASRNVSARLRRVMIPGMIFR